MTQSVQELLPHLNSAVFVVGFFSGTIATLLAAVLFRLGR